MVKVGIGGGPFLVWVTQVLTSGVEEGFDQGVGVVNTWGVLGWECWTPTVPHIGA